jgi:hypothetical protein
LGQAVDVPAAAPAHWDEVSLRAWFSDRFSDGTLAKPGANTLYVLFTPAGTSITYQGAASCAYFAGLHDQWTIAAAGSNPVTFALVPRCSFEPGDEFLLATNAASHELIESATNPSGQAWYLDGQDGTPLEAWQMLNGLEVSDLCENQSFDVVEGFVVQDSWSNAAVESGHNPCQPSDPSRPYFIAAANATIYHAAPGSTVTVAATGWSNQPTSDWELGINWGYLPPSDFDGHATLSRSTINHGIALSVTVNVPTLTPPSGGRLVYRFTIDSVDPINPNFYHPWPVEIVVP